MFVIQVNMYSALVSFFRRSARVHCVASKYNDISAVKRKSRGPPQLPLRLVEQLQPATVLDARDRCVHNITQHMQTTTHVVAPNKQ